MKPLGGINPLNQWESLWFLSIWGKRQPYLLRVFQSHTRIYQIGGFVSMWTFMSENFTSVPVHYVNSLYVFAKVS